MRLLSFLSLPVSVAVAMLVLLTSVSMVADARPLCRVPGVQMGCITRPASSSVSSLNDHNTYTRIARNDSWPQPQGGPA